ncbi:serine/threonine-protein kinase [Actinomyces bovis]|uniref:serine/threonine-protein kinase n=1 Tax=Actinomyces bovis TaxID=1658 RepID=UPI003899354C
MPGFRLENVIGRGGFATVYGGVQDSVQRPVAVKVDSRPLDDERNRRRYLREVQAAGRISGHPHVVSLVDTGVLRDGRPYIVMERCDGGSLEQLAATGPISAPDAVRLVLAAASALGAAHAAGILHRDVKPANILLDAYGSPRLTDFGIAAVVREGQDPTVTLECLTPDFAPPEAFELQPPGPAGDVWSMGATLFYLLTGRGPRRGPDGKTLSLPEIVHQLSVPVDLSAANIPVSLHPLLAKAMHRDPAQRYPDGTALAEALAAASEALGDGGLTVAGPGVALRLAQAGQALPAGSASALPGVSAGAQSRSSRQRLVAAAAAVGLVAGLAVGAGGTAALLQRSAAGSASAEVVQSGTPAADQAGVPAASAAPGAQSGGNQSGGTAATPQAGSAGGPAGTATTAAAQTPAYPQGTCLAGLVVISDVPSTRKVDCSQAHPWEVFAAGPLSESATGFTQIELSEDSAVKQACTRQAAVAYGEPDPHIEVIGPTETQWSNGARWFSCLVSPAAGGQRTGSYTATR